ncbi:MAG: hypothetical protein RLZ47_1591 [Bacteroidota bacterium]|jgi:protein tyrosine/serine phosphatase
MKLSYKNLILFLFIWLCTGFTLGTLTLLWPLRWWVDLARQQNLSNFQEKTGVIFLILLLITVSIWLSRLIFRWQQKQVQQTYTLLSSIIPFLLALAALALLMQPDLINKDTEQNRVSEQFTIGPYPSEEKIKELKAEGYTAIISLLHPAVVPFEPTLMLQEEELAKKYEIRLIEASMLPWLSDNESALNLIENLAKNKQERYYVHCYLGKDRVNLVKNLLVRLAGEEAVKVDKLSANRTFEEKKSLERGEVYRLAPGVYFTPYPTKEEFLAFFLASELKTVINIMDSTNLEHQKRIKEEREIFVNSDINFENHILNLAHTNLKGEMNNILTIIEKSPKPMVIHHWNTICPEAKFFIQQFEKQTHSKPINLNQAHVRTN